MSTGTWGSHPSIDGCTFANCLELSFLVSLCWLSLENIINCFYSVILLILNNLVLRDCSYDLNSRGKWYYLMKNKSARSQESQSFTAYTISKEQYDRWEWFFSETLIQSIGPTCSNFARFARTRFFVLTKIFEKKVCLNWLEMLWKA